MLRVKHGCYARCVPIVAGDPSSDSALHRFKFIISVAVCGDHTVEAYSNCWRTKVLYAVDFRSLLCTRIFLLKKPSVWFAFFECYLSVCSMRGLLI